MTCFRCGKDAPTKRMVRTQASGHSLPPSTPDFPPDFVPAPAPPRTEQVCGDCLTDFEFSLMLGPVVAFVLGGMLKNLGTSERDKETARAIEMVRSYFVVRNYDDSERERYAAVHAVGLSKNE